MRPQVDQSVTVYSSVVNRKVHDPCLFSRDKTSKEYLLVFVDDIIIIAENTDLCETIKKEIKAIYAAKDLGNCRYTLGIRITRNIIG